MELIRPAGKTTQPLGHTVLLCIHAAYSERWTETGEGMGFYTRLDIVRGRAEDRWSETERA